MRQFGLYCPLHHSHLQCRKTVPCDGRFRTGPTGLQSLFCRTDCAVDPLLLVPSSYPELYISPILEAKSDVFWCLPPQLSNATTCLSPYSAAHKCFQTESRGPWVFCPTLQYGWALALAYRNCTAQSIFKSWKISNNGCKLNRSIFSLLWTITFILAPITLWHRGWFF